MAFLAEDTHPTVAFLADDAHVLAVSKVPTVAFLAEDAQDFAVPHQSQRPRRCLWVTSSLDWVTSSVDWLTSSGDWVTSSVNWAELFLLASMSKTRSWTVASGPRAPSAIRFCRAVSNTDDTGALT